MSSDVIDVANDLAMHETESILRNHANRKERALVFTGRCYNCEDDVEEANFCDDDCRDDYDKRINKRKRDGYIS